MRRQINAEELNILFSSIGSSIWHIQNLEEALNICITIKKDIKYRGSMSPEKAEEILSKHRKNTLGCSLRNSKEAKIFSITLQDRLDRFKDERDWLVHRSVFQNRDDLYVDNKRYALIEKIRLISKEAIELQKLVSKDLEYFVVAQGVSQEWIYNKANQEILKLKGEKITGR